MTEAQRVELKLLVGGKALSAFAALPEDERFDLEMGFDSCKGNLYQLGAAMLRALCLNAQEASVGEVSGKTRIKLGPIEEEVSGSAGGVNTKRAENWCAEVTRLEKLAGSAGDFGPAVAPWTVGP